MKVEQFDTLFWFQLIRGDETDGSYPGTYRDIVFEDIDVEKVGLVLEVRAPAGASLSDVTFRNISIGEVERTFDIENADNLTFDNVTVGDQRIDGTLTWRAK